MRRALLLLAGLSACDFVHGALEGTSGDAAIDGDVDAPIDAPPTSVAVKFTTVSANLGSVRPGAYGWQVTAVLRNELPTDITNIRATLTFSAAGTDRASSFRWRDIDMREGVSALPATTLASNSEATFKFVVDALPSLVGPGPIQINGAATFEDGTSQLSATPAIAPASVPFVAMNAPIVVNTLTDEATNNTTTSLREAITQAKAVAGLDHIVFDPTVFVSGSVSTLSFSLGELPAFDGANGEIVIDGHGADVTLAVGTAWQSSSRWPFRVTGGQAVIGDITFKDFGYNYPAEDVSSNNCGSGNHNEGGAIRIDGGTLVLESNTFDDGNVAERNCYASILRYEGGTNHRIINNRWTNQSQDALYINANVREITGNAMDAGNNVNKVDECIFINSQGGQDLWLTGNLCVDQEYSAVVADGSDAGKLYVINNTFARNGRNSLSAVRRAATRQITFRNNFYIGNNPSAVKVNNTGTGFDFAYELLTSNPLCDVACGSANQVQSVTTSNPMVTNSAGATFSDFAPLAGSPLVDSGTAYIDRNGSAAGHFNGAGTERGAVEVP